MDIQAGTSAFVSRDIVIDNQYAFRYGERVVVETVTPNSQRPEYKYVVFSQQLQKRFQLSGSDIGLLADTSVPREVVSGSAQILQKQRRVIGSHFYKRLVVFGSIVLVSIAIVVLVVFLLEVGKQNKTEKAEKRVGTPTPAQTEDKPYTVGIADGKGEITINSVARTGGDGTNESDTLLIDMTLKNTSTDSVFLVAITSPFCLGLAPHPYDAINAAGGVTRIQNGTGMLIAPSSAMTGTAPGFLKAGQSCDIDLNFVLDPASVTTRKDFSVEDGVFVIDGDVGLIPAQAGQNYLDMSKINYTRVQLNIPLGGIP